MIEIRGFIAATLDGYIASPDGGIEWLEEFGKLDYGYEAFIAQIQTRVNRLAARPYGSCNLSRYPGRR